MSGVRVLSSTAKHFKRMLLFEMFGVVLCIVQNYRHLSHRYTYKKKNYCKQFEHENIFLVKVEEMF